MLKIEYGAVALSGRRCFGFVCLFAVLQFFVLPAWGTAITKPLEELKSSAQQPHSGKDKNAAAHRKMQRYQERLGQLQAEHGAYESSLSEAWFGLGDAQQILGMHKQAIVSFKRAMHVQRVNGGLYNLAIIPIIDRLIDSYASSRNWKEVDRQHDFLLSINREVYQWPDAKILPSIEKLANWNMYAFFENVDEMPLLHLKQAQSLFVQAAQLVIETASEKDLRLATFYRGQAVAEYYLNEYERNKAEQQQRFESVNQFGMNSNSYLPRSKSVLKKSHFNRLLPIKKMVEIYKDDDDASKVHYEKALVEMGDWYLIIGLRSLAFENYRKAYVSLNESGANDDMLKTLFSKPKLLGDFANDYAAYFDVDQINMLKAHVSMELDVDAVGRVTHVDVVRAEPENSSQERKAVRSMRLSRFRPRIIDGETVASTAVHYRHTYYYPVSSETKKALKSTN